MLAYVYAEDENHLIGAGDGLPWRLPADVKFFKDVTMRGDILSGRTTYETIPKRPLPGRLNIIMTGREDYPEEEGTLVVHSKEEFMDYYRSQDEDIYIIGGGVIFELFEDEVDELYRTIVHDTFEGDVYFPKDFDYSPFEIVETIEGPVDEKNPHPHTYEIWKRKEN